MRECPKVWYETHQSRTGEFLSSADHEVLSLFIADLENQEHAAAILEVLQGTRIAMALVSKVGFAQYELDPTSVGAIFMQKRLEDRST